MKSYEHLEGKIIKWKYSEWNNGEVVEVRVAGIDPDIGITLLAPYNPKNFFTCINGPHSPQGKALNPRKFKNWYKNFVTIYAPAIEAGFWDVDAIDAADKVPGGGEPSLDSCSFGA